MRTKLHLPSLAAISVICASFVQPVAQACTRTVCLGPEGTIITVRSMDCFSDLGTNLWLFPSGMKRDGACRPKFPSGLPLGVA
jgi:choloylglycine hydrolase